MSFLGKIIGKRKLSSDYILALDIGTAFIKALIFKIDRDLNRGIVVGVGRTRQRIGNMTSGAVSDIKGVIESCEDAIAQAEEMAGVENVEQTIIGIAGEFVKGTTTTVHYERAKPELRIDMPELKNIIQKVQWKAFDRIKSQMAWEVGYKEIEARLINADIVNVKIDGYRMNNPIGFQGKDVTIGIFNAYAPIVHIGALESIAEELGLKIMLVAAEPYAIVRSLGIEDNPKFGAIFIDIGGGTTDVAVVRDGVLEGTVMYALGGRAFTKKLVSDLGLVFAEAEQLKIKYAMRRMGQDVTKKIDDILESDCEIWLSGLEVALESFLGSKAEALPSRILLCGGGSALPGIHRALNSDDFFQRLPFANKPSVGFIQPRDIVKVVDQTKMLRSPQNVTPMTLASLAIDLTDEKKLMSEVLDKAVKVLQQ